MTGIFQKPTQLSHVNGRLIEDIDPLNNVEAFLPVCTLEELKEKKVIRMELQGRDIAVFSRKDFIFAIDAVCYRK